VTRCLCLAVAFAFAMLGATSSSAADDPSHGILGLFDIRNSPFIPIPEVATDPFGGTNVGLLPVYLVTNEERQITRIYAPDLAYNSLLGFGARFRVFDYPSEDTEWHMVAGVQQKIERRLEALYSTGIKRTEPWSWLTEALYDRSATGRFFGIGNGTAPTNETNYTQDQGYVDAKLGRNLTSAWQISLEMRPRITKIEPGVLEQSISPLLLGTTNDWLNRLAVTYDTRDSIEVPTRGTQITLFVGGADRHLLSSFSYLAWGVDLRHLWPLTERMTLASHAALREMPGGTQVPFWAQSRLGGDRSIVGEQQQLRGFGEGRFVDRNLFSGTLELRTRAFDLNLFSQVVSFEVAPFFDTGSVFHSTGDFPLSHLHPAGGIGFRAIARPFIVGYVDVGYGPEGAAIFTGVKYPF
jgi:surface antigen Omp85-like protein